jgi:GNAT superfamily N-acetyltransferase
MQDGVVRPGVAGRARTRSPPRCGARRRSPVEPDRQLPGRTRVALLREVTALGVEYQVRPARITDVERIVALVGRAMPSASAAILEGADLLRQLVYLPQASVLVAETLRATAGVAVLALHPSVREGGYVGTIDLLAVDPGHDGDRVTGVLLEEILRSARNKGCAVVEAAVPAGEGTPGAWERHGFVPAGPRLEHRIRAGRASAGPG